MPTNTQERSWNQLLDEAVRMRQTDIQGSIAQLRVLSITDFPFQPRAQQYLAMVLFDVGQYDEASSIFQQLVSQYSGNTSFRRENLCSAAQVMLVLGEYDLAGQYITQAKRIATESFDVVSHGRLRQLESIVTARKGQSDKALQEMVSGRRMVQAHRTFQEVSGQTTRTLTPIA